MLIPVVVLFLKSVLICQNLVILAHLAEQIKVYIFNYQPKERQVSEQPVVENKSKRYFLYHALISILSLFEYKIKLNKTSSSSQEPHIQYLARCYFSKKKDLKMQCYAVFRFTIKSNLVAAGPKLLNSCYISSCTHRSENRCIHF